MFVSGLTNEFASVQEDSRLITLIGFINGKYGFWVIDKKPRIYHMEPTMRYRKRSEQELESIIRSI